MAAFASDTDLVTYEPDIKNYGIQDFTDLHEQTYDDLVRLLNIKWWPTAQYGAYDLSVVGNQTKLSPSKLDATQFTRLAVFHVLAEYIYPRLSTFDPAGDSFREKMMHYKNKFEKEFDLILQEGVRYDLDSSGGYSDGEKQSFYKGRLVR